MTIQSERLNALQEMKKLSYKYYPQLLSLIDSEIEEERNSIIRKYETEERIKFFKKLKCTN